MGLLGRFFRGSLLWSEMWLMTWPEIDWYYRNHELQVTEEEVIGELSIDKKTGERKQLPPYEKIRKIVDERIEKRRAEINGKNQ